MIAAINAAMDLLEWDNPESGKVLLRVFSSDLADDGPRDGQD